MIDGPTCPAGWSIISDPTGGAPEGEEVLHLWDDPAGGLIVSQLGAKALGRYRLLFNGEMTLDVWAYDKLIIDRSRESPDQRAMRNHVLADQLFPRLLAHDGQLILHAGAFELSDFSVLIVGPSGRGKSSMVTSFDQAGFRMLGDDALIVSTTNGASCARAVYPSLRLFPDSINALLSANVQTTQVAHYTAKQRVNVPISARSANEPIPILAMFVLLEPTSEDRIKLDCLTLAEACMSLVESSFALVPSDTFRAAQRLEMASALARQVPAFAISYPRNYARLPSVREAILDQCMRLKQ